MISADRDLDEQNRIALLARRAIADLARGGGAARVADLDATVATLSEAAILPDPAPFAQAVDRLIRQGIGTDTLIDIVLPETARRLGQHWCDDRLSFLDVTVGSARVQDALVAATRRARPAGPPPPDQPQAAIIVPLGEDHRIGAIAACHAFERRGVRMRLIVGQPEDALAETLREDGFVFAGFSVSSAKAMDLTTSLVENLRRKHEIELPMVLGGPASSGAPSDLAETNDVLVTSDPGAVIEALGIRAVAAPGKQAAS